MITRRFPAIGWCAVVVLCGGCQAILDDRYVIHDDGGSDSSTGTGTDAGSDGDTDADADADSDSEVQTVRLFATGTRPQTLNGSRNEAKDVCAGTAPAFFGEDHGYDVEMFISMSSDDSIADMPSNFGFSETAKVVGPTGIEIADSWSELMSGNLHADMYDANVTNGETDTYPYWWSGSNASGGLAAACDGWTVGDDSSSASLGNLDSVSSSFLFDQNQPCDGWWRNICVAW